MTSNLSRALLGISLFGLFHCGAAERNSEPGSTNSAGGGGMAAAGSGGMAQPGTAGAGVSGAGNVSGSGNAGSGGQAASGPGGSCEPWPMTSVCFQPDELASLHGGAGGAGGDSGTFVVPETADDCVAPPSSAIPFQCVDRALTGPPTLQGQACCWSCRLLCG